MVPRIVLAPEDDVLLLLLPPLVLVPRLLVFRLVRVLVVVGLAADRLPVLVNLRAVRGALVLRDRAYLRRLRPLAQPPLRRDEDLHVDDRHDEERYKEGAQRRVDHVALALGQFADVRGVGCPVVPADQRRRADQERDYPDAADHEEDALQGALLRVVDRIGDRPEAVEGDRAQVQD